MNKEEYMLEALKYANKALEIDEVPVGAIIVKDNQIIGYGFNNRESNNDVTGHAEINAIQMAEKNLNSWRLVDCDMYVTLEPCLMCCGAIIQARINKVFYGTKDEKMGAVESLLHSFDIQGLNHFVKYEGNILEHECSEIIKNYFKAKRK